MRINKIAQFVGYGVLATVGFAGLSALVTCNLIYKQLRGTH